MTQRMTAVLTRRKLLDFGMSFAAIQISSLIKFNESASADEYGDVYTRYYDNPEKKLYLVYGDDITLRQNMLPLDRDILIQADTVRIGSEIRTPGNNIRIVAREINLGQGAEINTS